MNKKSKKSKLPVEREGIKADNPEKFYDFDSEEIGRGKFSVVKKVTCKETKKEYAAKIIKYDDVSIKYAIREFDVMKKYGKVCAENNDSPLKRSLPALHDAYIVRKYLILIMDLCDGKTLLEYFAEKKSAITEDDVATVIRWLCETLHELHTNNIVHLDIRPTNIRVMALNNIKLLDFNSARLLANKKAGEVVDVIGDTEFCAPEMLSFDRVQPQSDVWSVAVIMWILLSGKSPYYYENEDLVTSSVEKVKYDFGDDFDSTNTAAKDFIKAIFKRAPEMRLTAETALAQKWLKTEGDEGATMKAQRTAKKIDQQDLIHKTDRRLFSEEEEDYIDASLVFKTFEEEEYISPESEDDEE